MADRPALLRCAERLREVRDELERENVPFDPALGLVQVHLGAVVHELRALPVTMRAELREQTASGR